MTVKDKISAGLGRRNAAERRFRIYGISAIVVALACLMWLFLTIISNGYSAFQQTHIRLELTLDKELLDPQGTRDADVLSSANYSAVVKRAMKKALPKVKGRSNLRKLYKLISSGASFELRSMVLADNDLIGKTISVWLPSSDDVDMLFKGRISRKTPESDRRISDQMIGWLDTLNAEGLIEKRFNTRFFTGGDSREPEIAGVLGAVMGSLFTMAVTLALSFPLGVAAAIYLQEFAAKNRWNQLIEVNINNLAAVPSIVFGLLGLAVFLNFFGLPRSTPVVGGMVMALMTMPTIIIAGRAALGGVPPSIREAAFGLGASPVQVVFHHVLPLAMPGILTGSIIGMARALGESAPLLMIGMVAFIVDIPGSMIDPATVLPVQIYLWADSPETAFIEKTSAATLVLLAFLIAMNLIAVILRGKFEKKW